MVDIEMKSSGYSPDNSSVESVEPVAVAVAPAGGSNTPTTADKFGAAIMGLITGTVTICAPFLLLGGKKTRKNKRNKNIKRIRRSMKGGNDRVSENIVSERDNMVSGINNARGAESGHDLLVKNARGFHKVKHRHLKRTVNKTMSRQMKQMRGRTHRLKGGLKGGKVLDSGGFGCVFKPALKCKNKSRPLGKISKLMASGDTDDEFYEISKYEPILKKIPNYRNYFIIDDITICDPDKLTKEDLDNFGKCTAFKKYDLTPANINDNLKYLAMLNEPDGGPELDEYVKSNFTNYSKLIAVNNSLIGLLEHGIIPMNKLKIFHFDIKGSNILVSTDESAMHTRLIDWGLSKQLINNKDIMLDEISHRPFQFNLPYSIIIFDRKFIDAYEQVLSAKPRHATAAEIYTYTFNYLTELEKTDRGAHLRGVLRDFKMIFTGQFGMNTIAKYVVEVLVKYTKNNKLELHDYLSIFLHNVDIWGFAMAYLAFTDIISKKTHLDQTDRQIVECIRKVFTFLFQYNLSPISVTNLANILRTMNSAFKPASPNERKTVNLYVSKKNVQNSKSRLTNELKAEVKAK
jgi:serine/threonine protein kinase